MPTNVSRNNEGRQALHRRAPPAYSDYVLTEDQKREIRESGETHVKLAAKYGVTRLTIWRVKNPAKAEAAANHRACKLSQERWAAGGKTMTEKKR